MWKIKTCLWVRARLPLMSGGDSLGIDRRVVERHLLRCPGCRRRLEALHASQDALREAAATGPATASGHGSASLWPELARQIRESRRPRARAAWSFEPRRAWLWPSLGLVAGVLVTFSLIGRVSPDVPAVSDLTESAGHSLREFLSPRPAPVRLIKDEIAEAEDEARRHQRRERATQFSRLDDPAPLAE